AWLEMLERDRARFVAAAAQAAPSPLGAGALAGSTLPLPAPPGQLPNSLDAVADRDFPLDHLSPSPPLFLPLSPARSHLCLLPPLPRRTSRMPPPRGPARAPPASRTPPRPGRP